MFVTKCRFGVIDVHIPIIKGNDFFRFNCIGTGIFEKPSLNNFHQIQKKLTKSSKIDIKKLFRYI